MKVADADFQNLCLFRPHKEEHQRLSEDKDAQADDKTEENGAQNCAFDSGADTLRFFCAEILSNKGREGISKILHGHIGERVNFYGCRKSCHYGSSEAVYQALYHEDSQIHDRLLKAGEDGGLGDLREHSFFQAELPGRGTEFGKGKKGVQSKT